MSDQSAEHEDLTSVVRELELHASSSGWDLPPRLFALVETQSLLEAEPGLADQLNADQRFTSIEQEDVPAEGFEQFLYSVSWPDSVAGVAACLERVVLPAEADDDMPEDPEEAASYAANHPSREEVRIVGAVTRVGGRACAMRLRKADDDQAVMIGSDIVPGLLELLATTFESDPAEDHG